MATPIFRPDSKMLTPTFNPQTKTRYLVILPSEFNIEPFQISKIKLPTISSDRNWFLGMNMNLRYSDCEMEIINGASNDSTKKLMELMSKMGSYEFRVELLDPLGMVTSDYKLNGYIKSIQFDELEYGDDGLFKTKLIFGINHYKL